MKKTLLFVKPRKLGIKASKKLEKKVKQSYDT